MREGWREVRLGDICNITSSKRIFADDYRTSGIPFYRGKEIIEKQKGSKISTELYIDEQKYQSICEKFGCPTAGDILLTSVGTLGIPYVVGNEKFYFKDGNLTWLKNFRNSCSRFLYYWLLSPNGRYQIDSKCIGSTQKALTIETLLQFTIPLPPLPEQRAIAATLSCLDDKIELNNRINANLEAQAQAVFKSWFVDFEPFQDGEFVDSELGMIPKGWKVEKLGAICESISKTHKFNKDELIFLNTGDIEFGTFLHSDYSRVAQMPGQAKKSIQEHDVLYSEIRPINKHFAYVSFIADDYVVSTKLMVIRSKSINSRRLYHYLTSVDVILELQQEAESRSGTFPQIRFENISNLTMIIATPKVENDFIRFLESYYSIIDANVNENRTLAALRDALLPKLMSGEIKVVFNA